MSKEAEKAFERYTQILKVLNEEKDQKGLKFLEDLINKCTEYFRIIAEQKTLKLREDKFATRKDFAEEYGSLDELRTILHNALISQIKILNRYLFKNYKVNEQIPLGGIYTYNLDSLTNEDRRTIGDWAFSLAEALFKHHVVTQD